MKTKANKKKMVNISFTLPPELEAELVERSQKADIKVSQIIRQALREFIERNEGQKKAA
jgi:metal-responsive CopG/Arc/MetJ family transcriptional regulator